MTPQSPIGVFDSGLGGLSVLAEIRQVLPLEQLIYVADSAYVPYGDKSTEAIIERSIVISEFLLDQGVKALVIACNTATAAAIHVLRERWPNLICVGMEPAVKPAARVSKTGKVGVLATTGTLRSAKFAALLDKFSAQVEVHTQPCPGLVELIEAGELNGTVTRELLASYVEPLLQAQCDTFILGCTHYPFIKPLLRTLLPAEIEIIDTGAAVARRLQQQLTAHELLATRNVQADQFYTSGSIDAMQQAMPALWPHEVRVTQLLR